MFVKMPPRPIPKGAAIPHFNSHFMKNGININFFISRDLTEKIDGAINTWGFGSRAEFFRFCAIEFLRFDAQAMPPDETLKGYSKTILSVKASKELAKRHLPHV